MWNSSGMRQMRRAVGPASVRRLARRFGAEWSRVPWHGHALTGRGRTVAIGRFAAVARAVLALAAASAAQAAVPSPAAASVRQLITVTATSHSATYATVRAYRVSRGKRIGIFGPWRARVGYNGIAESGKKREGEGRTPSGIYGFGFFFGVLPDRGFSFRFRFADADDYWDDDPASARYNEWVDARWRDPGADPEPLHVRPAYDYAAVIAYNTARVRGLGSAIFLHVGTGSPTAGCLSLPFAELVRVLRWLKPADHPQISISAR
jgi:L,D-peptidoglycan transpeptidase YkuD (ErfK/YbiS/YcfS/YnhG family)